MSGNAFVGDQFLVDVSFDTAGCQLRRLAADGVLLGAAQYAYRAGLTGLIRAAGPAAAPPAGRGGARRSGGNGQARPAAAALAGDRARRRRVPGPRCRPDASPCRRADHGPRGGRCIPAARTGGNRAGPGHRALLRRHDHPQLHRPARLRPHPSHPHSRSGRPHATGKTDAMRWLNAIEVPQRPASPPELALGGPVHASRQFHRPHPARLPGRRPKVPGAGTFGRWRAPPRWDGLAVTREPQADAE